MSTTGISQAAVTSGIAVTSGVAGQALALAREVEGRLAGSPFAGRAAAVTERLTGPLRVAIAGRVKAGKSTLLNALVGERLAPTDAGECTRLISWYRHGTGYEVSARLRHGGDRPLTFRRDSGALDIGLDGLAEDDVAGLDIRWPASTLQQLTLIDTPGLASLNDENSRRTREFLDHDADGPADADAVIYLMRHLHRSDVAFLDAFLDRSVTAASPVNAVAVLSRADEIGAGRLDAMASAATIAARYRADEHITSLAATVVPMAGLLAETGLTLTEAEATAIRQVAASPNDDLNRMLLSAGHFTTPDLTDVPAEARRHLLDRLGLFGVRIAVREVRSGLTTAAQLGPKLVEHSGLAELRQVIGEHFLPRARTLQARSAIAALRALARDLRQVDPAVSDRIDREAERIEAGAVEFTKLRAAHLVASGEVEIPDGHRADLQRLLLGGTPGAAFGAPPDAGPGQVQRLAIDQIDRWRRLGAHPLATPALVEVTEAAARTAESWYAAAA